MVNTPSYLKWVPQISLIRWAYEGLCINEFSDLTLTQDPWTSPRRFPGLSSAPYSAYPGSKVLDTMGFSDSSIKKTLLAQAGIIAFNYVFTCIVLMSQGKPRNNHSTSSSTGGRDASVLAMKYESAEKDNISIQAMNAAHDSMVAKSLDDESIQTKSAAADSMIAKSLAIKSMRAMSATDKSMDAKSIEDEWMEAKSIDEESMEAKSIDDESVEAKSIDDVSMELNRLQLGGSKSSDHLSFSKPFTYTQSLAA